jgi:signal peptidase I
MKRRLYLWLMAFVALASGCGDVRWNTGDRVLVSKCQYESGLTKPARYDVVVFKYPKDPTKRGTPYNYIKRLMGLPGEILAILFGRVYVFTPDAETPLPESLKASGDPKDQWKYEHTQPDSADALDLFYAGKFKITRKPIDVMLATRRPVFLNNHQPADLQNVNARWKPADKSAWTQSEDRKTLSAAAVKDAKNIDWVRYQHLVVFRIHETDPLNRQTKVRVFENQGKLPDTPELRNLRANTVALDPSAIRPQLITDEMSYNSNLPLANTTVNQGHWVGDLMLECKVNVTAPDGEFWMELSKGVHRYRARFNLADGECELFQVFGEQPTSLGKKSTPLKGAGTHTVRFANVDARLTVWVDGKLPFDDGVPYHPDEAPTAEEAKDFLARKISRNDLMLKMQDRRGPTPNDLQPASLGVKGAAVTVADIALWHDCYYSTNSEHGLTNRFRPEDCTSTRAQEPGTFYISPGHYFCLGDNSPASADSRTWGTVPERLMLGRALLIYWPLNRIGTIR